MSLMQLQQGYGAPAAEYGYPQTLGDLQNQNLYPAQTYINVQTDKGQQTVSRFGAGEQGMADDMYMNRRPQTQDDYKVVTYKHQILTNNFIEHNYFNY